MTTARYAAQTSILGLALAVLLLGCAPAATPSPTPTDLSTGVVGTVTAGPVCPVERPGDLQCAPRPVSKAEIVAIDGSGAVVAQTVTDAVGGYSLAVPAGRYTIQARDVQGLMGLPPPTPVTVVAGTRVTVDLQYDTGIR